MPEKKVRIKLLRNTVIQDYEAKGGDNVAMAGTTVTVRSPVAAYLVHTGKAAYVGKPPGKAETATSPKK